MKKPNTQSDIFVGRTVRRYSLKQRLGGLKYLYNRALAIIEPRAGESLLDVGCGTGTLLGLLAERFGERVHLFGVDGSPDVIERAKREIGNTTVKLKIAYADDLPFVNESLDWVISTLVLHHLPQKMKEKMVSESFRVLRPGGKLYVADLGRPRGIFGHILAFLSYRHSYTKNNIEIALASMEKVGFRVQNIERQMGFIEHILAEKPARVG